MIGHIESYNPETETGTIKSEEKIFTFQLTDWIAPALPEEGDDVNFDGSDSDTAKNINLVGVYLEKPKAVKYKYLAALLAILFGFAGLHRLYLGYYRLALAQIILTIALVVTGFIVFAPQWGFIEAFLIFGGHINKDGKGRPLK